MKSLKISALTLALATFSICWTPAAAQQEVNPDHYDQPTSAEKQPPVSKRQAKQKRQGHGSGKALSAHSRKPHRQLIATSKTAQGAW